MKHATALIIGSTNDLHVQSVLEWIGDGSALVVDVDSLSQSRFSYRESSIVVETSSGSFELSEEVMVRGWVRRLAPPDWQRGVTIGSMRAAEKASWLSLMGAISRAPYVEWLTTIDDGLIAENKLYQLDVARRLAIPVPATVVSNLSSDVVAALPGDRIIKPLGPSHYFDGDNAQVVYTQVATQRELEMLDRSSPFLIQEFLVAETHLRVVVVKSKVWVATLHAQGLPIDWRSESAAHYSFEESEVPPEVREGALAINHALRLGYSSQDWVVTRNGVFLLDVNPGGQWLFLPQPIGLDVSRAIAEWIVGAARDE